MPFVRNREVPNRGQTLLGTASTGAPASAALPGSIQGGQGQQSLAALHERMAARKAAMAPQQRAMPSRQFAGGSGGAGQFYGGQQPQRGAMGRDMSPQLVPNRAMAIAQQGQGVYGVRNGLSGLGDMVQQQQQQQQPQGVMPNMDQAPQRTQSGLFNPVSVGQAAPAALPRGWPPQGGLPSMLPMIDAYRDRKNAEKAAQIEEAAAQQRQVSDVVNQAEASMPMPQYGSTASDAQLRSMLQLQQLQQQG